MQNLINIAAVCLFGVFLALLVKFFIHNGSDRLVDRIEFAIPSTNGNFQLSDYKGQTVFLFFGFTRCPQICPTTLLSLSAMFAKLSNDEKKLTKVLFVSIDPENDSMEVLKNHMSRFGEEFIGATDTDENLKKLTNEFGAFYKREPLIDHTSTIYVINKYQQLVDVLPFTASAEELLQAHNAAASKPSILKHVQEKHEVELVAENKDCDLSKSTCELQYGEATVKLTFSLQPIVIEKPMKVLFQASSANIVPEALDIRGVELNMGYIHPLFKKVSHATYEAELSLPLCELSKMNWLARVLLTKKTGEPFKALQFRFTTEQNF